MQVGYYMCEARLIFTLRDPVGICMHVRGKGREGKRWMNDMHANVRGEKRMDSHVHALNFKIKRS